MAGIHQLLQFVRRAIGVMRREEIHTVVTPTAFAGKFHDRHQLDVRYTKRYQMIQLFNGRINVPAGVKVPMCN